MNYFITKNGDFTQYNPLTQKCFLTTFKQDIGHSKTISFLTLLKKDQSLMQSKMQQKFNQNQVQMSSKCSKISVKMRPKLSQNAVKIQS